MRWLCLGLPRRPPPSGGVGPAPHVEVGSLRARSLAKKLTTASGQLPAWPQARFVEMMAALAGHPPERQRLIYASLRALAAVDSLEAFDAFSLVALVAPWDVARSRAVCSGVRCLGVLWRDVDISARRAECLRGAAQLACGLPLEGLRAQLEEVANVARRLRVWSVDLPDFFDDVARLGAPQRAEVLSAAVVLRQPGRAWGRCDDLFLGLARVSTASRQLLLEQVAATSEVATAPAAAGGERQAIVRDSVCAVLLAHPEARWPTVVAHLQGLLWAMAGDHIDAVHFAIALRRQWPLPPI